MRPACLQTTYSCCANNAGDVLDGELAKHWVVHPYLFMVNNPDRVRLDWQHVDARWVAPAELANYETVPKLREALAEVYP